MLARFSPGVWGRAFAVSVGYLAAWAALRVLAELLVPANGFFSWFPPAGLTLYLLIRFGVRYAPLAVVAPFINWAMYHAPTLTAEAILVYGLINATGFGLTAWVLVRLLHVERNLSHTRDLALFFVLGAFVAPFLVGMYSVNAFVTLGVFPPDASGEQAFRFWIGDATGIVTFAPLLFYLFDPLISKRRRAGHHVRFPQPLALIERTAQGIAIIATPSIVLHYYFSNPEPRADYLYIALVPIGWVVLRNGSLGASFATFFLDLFTLLSLKLYAADLWMQTELQVFMLTASITAFTVGVTVSERANAVNKLKTAEWQLARAHDVASVMTVYLNEDGSWRNVSANFTRCFGIDANSSGTIYDLCVPEDRISIENAIGILQRGERSAIDLATTALAADGTRRMIEVSLSQAPERSGEDRWILAFITDVTARVEAEEKLERAAYIDALTGLPNRAGLERQLNSMLSVTRADGRSLAVIHVDLGNLKLINDSLGYAAGDEFLIAVTRRLTDLLIPGEIAARVSGDEFVIVLRGDGATRERSERGLAALSACYLIGETEVYPAASVGYGIFDDPMLDAQELMRRANLALNRAKLATGVRVKAYRETDDASAARVGLIARLHRAVQLREFELHYQPIVDLRTGEQRIIAIEALLRWREGGTTLHAPASFLPVLERNALMETVGTWIVGEAVRQAAEWQRAGYGYAVWINVALRQLWEPHFVERIASLLNEHGCTPSSIVIEVTETDAMRDFERVSQTFRDLRQLGVGIAIDDFGVGESSLARLRDLPVDILKIDGSFVSDIERDPRARQILDRIVDLAETLNLATVCEWIESGGQSAIVSASGAQYGQGYFFGAARPAAEVPGLRERPARA